MRYLKIAVLILCCAACGSGGGGGGTPTPTPTPSPTPSPTPQNKRLKITNSCSYTIWIQQQNMPADIPSVVELASGASQEWAISDAGLASTRFWPKTGCDSTGQNCTVGQSSDPCPATGCAPPVDSKIEATWGCTAKNPEDCAVNPSNTAQKLGDTYWNMSAVDGYTLPFTASVSGNTINDASAQCANVNCADLSQAQCPTSENLSVGEGGAVNTTYSSVNLRVLNSSSTQIGCYAPCKVMNYPTFGGFGLSETNSAAVMYCCPTPPVSVAACRAGPVVGTSYVSGIHSMCGSTVYGYAYDDTNGLRHCSANTKVQVTFGPNCP